MPPFLIFWAGAAVLSAAAAWIVLKRAGPPPVRAEQRAVLAAAVAAPLTAMGLYLLLGSSAAPDLPYERRVEAWREADPRDLGPAEMAAVLSDYADARPDDPQLLHYLGRARLSAGDFHGAVRAFERATRLAPTRAESWAGLGEAFTTAADGEVTADAAAAFQRALKLDPGSAVALYQLGRGRAQAGDVAGAQSLWIRLRDQTPSGDPAREALEQELASLQATPDEAAIRGMVEGLARRLEAAPNDPEGWARLVRAYGVLGLEAERASALARARSLFARDPRVLQALDAAAGDTPNAPPLRGGGGRPM